MKIKIILACFALAGPVQAQILPAPASFANVIDQAVKTTENTKRLTSGNVLLTDADLQKARLTECQPSRGDLVLIKEVKSAAGVTMASVEVQTGQCKNAVGWVGTERYESLN